MARIACHLIWEYFSFFRKLRCIYVVISFCYAIPLYCWRITIWRSRIRPYISDSSLMYPFAFSSTSFYGWFALPSYSFLPSCLPQRVGVLLPCHYGALRKYSFVSDKVYIPCSLICCNRRAVSLRAFWICSISYCRVSFPCVRIESKLPFVQSRIRPKCCARCHAYGEDRESDCNINLPICDTASNALT